MVCLGNEQRSFSHFWDCIQILHFGLFCWPWWLLHWIDTFKLRFWKRLLRVPWLSRRSNLSLLNEINPEKLIGRTDAEAEAPILWPLYQKSWLIRKDHDAGKDWGQEEKGVREDEMFGWYHWLSGHEFEKTQGDSEGQRGLDSCSSWGHKELDRT